MIALFLRDVRLGVRAGGGVQVVRRLGVDRQVDAGDLVLLADPEPEDLVDGQAEDPRGDQSVDEHGAGRVHPAGDVGGRRRQADPDEADGAVGERAGGRG